MLLLTSTAIAGGHGDVTSGIRFRLLGVLRSSPVRSRFGQYRHTDVVDQLRHESLRFRRPRPAHRLPVGGGHRKSTVSCPAPPTTPLSRRLGLDRDRVLCSAVRRGGEHFVAVRGFRLRMRYSFSLDRRCSGPGGWGFIKSSSVSGFEVQSPRRPLSLPCRPSLSSPRWMIVFSRRMSAGPK